MIGPVASPPHVVAGFTVPRVMFQVLAALLPVVAVQVYLHGPAILWLLAVACLTALACEALALGLRRRPARDALRDGAEVVTQVERTGRLDAGEDPRSRGRHGAQTAT